jgi:hypothetical protein
VIAKKLFWINWRLTAWHFLALESLHVKVVIVSLSNDFRVLRCPFSEKTREFPIARLKSKEKCSYFQVFKDIQNVSQEAVYCCWFLHMNTMFCWRWCYSFPLWNDAAFELNFGESINRHHFIGWFCWPSAFMKEYSTPNCLSEKSMVKRLFDAFCLKARSSECSFWQNQIITFSLSALHVSSDTGCAKSLLYETRLLPVDSPLAESGHGDSDQTTSSSDQPMPSHQFCPCTLTATVKQAYASCWPWSCKNWFCKSSREKTGVNLKFYSSTYKN